MYNERSCDLIDFRCLLKESRFYNFFYWIKFSMEVSLSVGRLTLVGQRPMKNQSRASVRLSVCLSVRPSLSFLKIGSLVFSDIVQGDSWPWYVVTDEARFAGERLAAQIWAKNRLKSGPKLVFLPFSQVWFISFPWNCMQW